MHSNTARARRGLDQPLPLRHAGISLASMEKSVEKSTSRKIRGATWQALQFWNRLGIADSAVASDGAKVGGIDSKVGVVGV